MSKPDLILLHGALFSAAQFDALRPLLAESFEVHTFDFEGHGGRPLPEGREELRMERFADNIEHFIREKGLARVRLFGYSMGGYAALWLAANKPGLVHSVVAMSTKIYWTPEFALREARFLDPEKTREKVPAFAEALRLRHAALAWESLMCMIAESLRALGENNLLTDEVLRKIEVPVMLLGGALDQTVPPEEVEKAAARIPGAQYRIIPDTPHPFEKAAPEAVSRLLLDFWKD